MSDYTITTDFGAKDSLPSGNAAKIIKGSEFTTEFTNIKTAVNTKADTVSPTFTGAVTFDAAVTINSTATITGDLTVDTNTLFVDVSENRVGIGTSSPYVKTEIIGGDLAVGGGAGASNLGFEIKGVPLSAIPSAQVRGYIATADSGIGVAGDLLIAPRTSVNASVRFITGTSPTERMRIDSSGNVGIGTSSPDEKLVVKGGTYAANQSGGMALQMGDEGGSHWKARFKIKSDGSGVPRTVISGVANNSGGSIDAINISNTGNVGIGTTSPANTLTVGNLTASANDQDATVGIKCNANHRGIILQENSGAEQWEIGVGAAGALKFYDSGSATPAVTFADETGKVGIGTDSPSYTLDIESTSPIIKLEDTDTNTQMLLNANSGVGGFNFEFDSTSVASAPYAAFKMSGSEAMRIDSSGNVGIGTTSPSAMLDVELGATGTIAEFRGGDSDILQIKNENDLMVFDTRNTTSGLAFQMQGAERMRIDSSGNVLVGTTSADIFNSSTQSGVVLNRTLYAALQASNDGQHAAIFNRLTSDGSIVQFRKDGTTVGSISVTGSATAYNTSSDERLKENITDSTDAGSKVDAIQIRQFDWKADGSHQDYGVIAQELINVAPEAVSEGDTEEDMMGVDYSKLVPMLIKEVQTLRNRVAQLENN